MKALPERFVSEAIQPAEETFGTKTWPGGEPGLPKAFLRGNETLEIVQTLGTFKETGLCKTRKEHCIR